ncbi:AbrB/MazE/SpoVT family DNA-binding domain-containing protein [Natronococcus sp. A-GB1]|uniref:AbrB/MazE/SpoVT family DNA-binding domain-containing protein n=1 Tax=Natronococcus sp. A-GB1 TaxID=3037648 RepID=UPI00241DC379|nr:AbrB/MazE/SpoVT family DNA-binding domain-containing protein [Natronococcus sp. A-GB1]MDG5760458.1 AbrB/MazE/SpoVT family DNA-binding domain-containing protein [Natronococcus sp. A-GB1]
MSEASLDDRGRLTLPKEVRERYGDQYHIVQLPDGIKLVPIADDPLEALRDEFADVDKSADELREDAREAALDEAGR